MAAGLTAQPKTAVKFQPGKAVLLIGAELRVQAGRRQKFSEMVGLFETGEPFGEFVFVLKRMPPGSVGD